MDDTLPVYTSIECPKAEILGGPKVLYAVHLYLLIEVTSMPTITIILSHIELYRKLKRLPYSYLASL
jgi:hypothetical protein